jgi:hypothetical protein
MPLDVRLQWQLKLGVFAGEPPVEIELRRDRQFEWQSDNFTGSSVPL